MKIIKKITDLKKKSGVMKYFANTSWLFAERLLRMSLGLLVGVWVARYLGPERFGLFSYAQSIAALFTTVATLGLDSIVVKKLVDDQSDRDKILGTSFTLKFISAIFILILLWITLSLSSEDYQTNILIFIIASSTIFQSFNVIDLYFQSKILSKYIVYANTFSLLLSSFLKIILILNNAPLVTFAYLALFDSAVLAVGFLLSYKFNFLSILKWKFDNEFAKNLLKESWPLILSAIVVTLYMRIDQIMIKNMLGSVEVGQYTAAIRLSEVWYFIPVVISTSLFPAIINSRKISQELYYSRMQKLYDLMFVLSVIIGVIIMFLGRWIVYFLYGSEFSDAYSVLIIHIWSAVFVFLGVASSKWFIAEGLQKYSLYRTIFGAVLNILLNLYLIPHYGINGAAVATLFSQITASYLFNIVNRKTRITFFLHTKALLLPFRVIGFRF
ncbi:flippase [Moritella sp. F3]|uniref:flippase n=1 Tax=Moritella sp. F3 TaxID=2718882 RepID=UPI0018E12BCC|nr:flippase [Moritella sp. F3]GIC77264.1 O-unit flippase [Moritella sp. F1]GIC83208.1 O-unit flippase [Moritella sp. F3]